MNDRWYLVKLKYCDNFKKQKAFDYITFKKDCEYLIREYDSTSCFSGGKFPYVEHQMYIDTPMVKLVLDIDDNTLRQFQSIKIIEDDFVILNKQKDVGFTDIDGNYIIPTQNNSDYIIMYRNKYLGRFKTKKDAVNHVKRLIEKHTLIFS